MKLREIMTKKVHTIEPSASLKSAAEVMKKQDIGALPVCQNEKVVGILTDRDIVVRAIAQGSDPASVKVEDVMSRQVLSCSEDEEVQEAAQLMRQKKIRRLLVETAEQKPAGIVSLGDLAQYAGDEADAEKVLEEVSSPGKKH